MTAFAVTPPSRPRPAGRVWLPLALSLGLHALFGLVALVFSVGHDVHAGGPLPVDVVVLDDGGGTIILDGPSRGGPDQRGGVNPAPPRNEAEESEEAFSATVIESPVMPAASPSPGGADLAAASGAPSAAGAGGGEGTGGGLLRAPATARNVVYVIDRSLSMGFGGGLAVAKRELLAGIEALPREGRFAVILYNRQSESLSVGGQTGLLPATEANRAAVARLVDEVRAEGGTDHLAALRRAVALGPDVIFFVTDADEMTAEQVRNVALLNHGGAAIHAVQLNNQGQRREETPLQLLARLSGGTYRVIGVK